MRAWTSALSALLVCAMAGSGGAVEVPPEGDCPPYPVEPGKERASEDVIPPQFEPGERIHLDGVTRLQGYLPWEVWERRDIFFYEGMQLEVGPCHRRYPAPPFFQKATDANVGRTHLDEEGNLLGYSGAGLPFRPDTIAEGDPEAGQKWAWNLRYRYQGAGFRGKFRILHVMKRGRKIERYEGDMFMLPLHGVPGEEDDGKAQFAAGGRFTLPNIARGVAWRQFRPIEADQQPERSDDIFVWMPDERRVRRAAPTSVDGLFMPAYTRGLPSSSERMQTPQAEVSTPSPGVAVAEHWRRGFVGLYLRPNAWRFGYIGARDVIAPINSAGFGYPVDSERSYGPSGLSVASDRWEIRRAVVLEGTHRTGLDPVASIKLFIDALTQQPLYLVSRRGNRSIQEVGIFVGRYSGDDPLAVKWEGNDKSYGVILPVAETMFVAGGESWLRESYELRADPPDSKERARLNSTTRLQRGH